MALPPRAWAVFILINPFWPDAQPYDTYILASVAALVAWLNRASMLGREAAVTQVLPDRF